MRTTVIIEQNSKGRYSAYINDDSIKFGVLGEGDTVGETIEDFNIGYEEMKETYQKAGKPFPDLEFDFKYDTASFLQYYTTYFSLAGLYRLTGINQRQLSQYLNGTRNPNKQTIVKIDRCVHDFARKLSLIQFV